MGNGIDGVTWVVMFVLLAAIIQVVYPGTIAAIIHQVAAQIGLP
ncbi:MAG TPA: hypothetical protein VNL16_13160 [Chloroflexota bacterium]|nr:hypothetical protein [Chloroflexota bacterium]